MAFSLPCGQALLNPPFHYLALLHFIGPFSIFILITMLGLIWFGLVFGGPTNEVVLFIAFLNSEKNELKRMGSRIGLRSPLGFMDWYSCYIP
jgi:hypothetical protein